MLLTVAKDMIKVDIKDTDIDILNNILKYYLNSTFRANPTSITTIRMTNDSIRKVKKRAGGIQNGARTQIHDQSICSVSLRTIKISPSTAKNGKPVLDV